MDSTIKFVITARDLAGHVVLSEDGDYVPAETGTEDLPWLFDDEEEARQEAAELCDDMGDAFSELTVREISVSADGTLDWDSVRWA